jgi:RecA-family ATPase
MTSATCPRSAAELDERADHLSVSGLGEWDAGDDDAPIPPRGWLLGNIFCRQFMSMLLAGGGVGKTALRYAQYLSLTTGRPLTGDHVFQRCRVLVVSLEDSPDELRRRMRAAMLTGRPISGHIFAEGSHGRSNCKF